MRSVRSLPCRRSSPGTLPQRWVLVLGMCLALGACSAEERTGPATGSVRVTVTTSGAAVSPPSYAVSIDGRAPQALGPEASATVPDLEVGTHTVGLSGVPGSCALEGENPRAVEVTAGATAEVSFSVTCAPETGTIAVTTTTTGPSPDPDGYTIVLDGGTSHPIAVNATATIGGLPPGVYRVALEGLAPNCTPAADANPQPATVVAGQTAAVTFAVTCHLVEPGWTTLPLPPDLHTTGLWASGPTDIYVAAGSHRMVLHYDGTGWAEVYRGEHPYAIQGVWGLSPSEVFAFGEYSLVRFDGSQWVADEAALSDGPLYRAMWGSSPTDLFAVGSREDIPNRGLIVHYDGASWSRMEGHEFGTNGIVSDISGTGPADVYAIGSEYDYDAPPEEKMETAAVVHYDGTSWSRSFEDTRLYGSLGYSLTAIWANAHDDVFVVASDGRIRHFDGTAWSEMESPTAEALRDVWGGSSAEVYAVGDAGILRYDGVAWTVVSHTPSTHVWGTGDHVFVAVAGAILHRTR